MAYLEIKPHENKIQEEDHEQVNNIYVFPGWYSMLNTSLHNLDCSIGNPESGLFFHSVPSTWRKEAESTTP